MQSHSRGTLLERVRNSAPRGGAALVPVDYVSVFESLADEMALIVAEDPGTSAVLLVDGRSAAAIARFEQAVAVADHVFVFGECHCGWTSAENVHIRAPGATVQAGERFFVYYSSYQSFALVGQAAAEEEPENAEEGTFNGAWTGLRAHVKAIAAGILAEDDDAPAFPAMDPLCAERAAAAQMRQVGLLARRLTALERHLALDRSDLYSVLEILKAISAKRRSHDILFVFVEHIARVVQMDRCSVVRVWAAEKTGHVLASHEDETVANISIELSKYPEIERALETRDKVVIHDVRRDPLTREFADELKRANITSLAVIPIVLYDPNVGSLLLRAARSEAPFASREIGFFEIVANAASNALERAHLFERIQHANERLERLATTDGLTGLHNHRFFRKRLEEEFDRAQRYRLPLSCLIFDIDNFKGINDSRGHLQGDSILRQMARRIKRITRKSDLVARYGGEEFAVIMPQTDVQGAASEAERLRSILSDHPYSGMPPDFPVTVSVGVAALDHDTMLDCESLIRLADGALYEAKRGGKNRVVVADPKGA